MVGKKSVLVFGIFGLFLFSMFGFVLGQGFDANDPAGELSYDFAEDNVMGMLAGRLDGLGLNPALLSSILLGVLLFIVIHTVVGKVFFKKAEGKYINWIGGAVSLIIVFLSFLYIPRNFIDSVVLQYGAMGMAILAIIPFAIILYYTSFVTKNVFVSKGIWMFYIVYYFGLFIYRVALDGFESWGEYIPYIGAIGVGIAMVVFMSL